MQQIKANEAMNNETATQCPICLRKAMVRLPERYRDKRLGTIGYDRCPDCGFEYTVILKGRSDSLWTSIKRFFKRL